MQHVKTIRSRKCQFIKVCLEWSTKCRMWGHGAVFQITGSQTVNAHCQYVFVRWQLHGQMLNGEVNAVGLTCRRWRGQQHMTDSVEWWYGTWTPKPKRHTLAWICDFKFDAELDQYPLELMESWSNEWMTVQSRTRYEQHSAHARVEQW